MLLVLRYVVPSFAEDIGSREFGSIINRLDVAISQMTDAVEQAKVLNPRGADWICRRDVHNSGELHLAKQSAQNRPRAFASIRRRPKFAMR